MRASYDCIVVGAGAAGSIIAYQLTKAGKSVLLLERGPKKTYSSDPRRDHLRNQRYSLYGHNAGPDDGAPRVFVDPQGVEHTVLPYQPGYHANAALVGGGTVVYGGQAWRFLPKDFRMASTYGVPKGSSLVDWPIAYEDLAPWYERAEWEIGVSGDNDGNVHQGKRAKGYPMPAMPAHTGTKVLRQGASTLGINTFTPPLLMNSVPHDGRAACIQCGSCVGFPCPSDAKNGMQNTVLPKALATGLCDLLSDTMVESIDVNDAGRVTGVTYLTPEDSGLNRYSAQATAVVVSAGAIESARLLQMSHSKHHPKGLGNAHGQVGLNLQGHYYPTAYGYSEQPIYDPRGPGASIATTDFNHGNDGVIGGGMLADDFVMLPIIAWKMARPDDVPHWGKAAKDFMRDGYRRLMKITGPVHEIPTEDCRVALDTHVKDAFGLPVARLSGVAHEETVRTAKFMFEQAGRWLDASGASRKWGREPFAYLSGGQHQAGTCRMGEDPERSVTDVNGRVWGHDNLFVSDASLHPTNGGFNPVLTVMALAFRNGEHVAGLV